MTGQGTRGRDGCAARGRRGPAVRDNEQGAVVTSSGGSQ
jgi:hypothetical protein